MDVLDRTSRFLAHRDSRRADLRDLLAKILATPRALTLEIGSGHGHFLTAYAIAHPERFCVGIDIMRDRVDRALRKRDRARLQNLEFIQADATEFLEVLPPGIHLRDIFILFPDPWPKRRHHKNRIVQQAFLDALAEKTEKGAHLFFRTDYAPYFAEAQREISRHTKWSLEETTPWPFELQTVFQSRAAKYESLGARVR